jgi:methionyl-tRNA formyltransferase
MQKPFAIPDDANVEYVYDGLMHLGAAICLETLDAIIAADGHPKTMSQEEFSIINYQLSISEALKLAPKIFKETCEVNWRQPAKRIYDFVRGLSPYPGAWTTLVSADGRETVLKLFKSTKTGRPCDGEAGQLTVDKRHVYVSCTDEWLQVDELQLAGKKRMDATAFVNGMKDLENYFVK